MGMHMGLKCIYCVVEKADSLYDQYGDGDDEEKKKFMQSVFKLVGDEKENDTAPYMSYRVTRLLKNKLGLGNIYTEVKERSNKFMLSIEQNIKEEIDNADWPLLLAIQYAMVGNYIDYGAMDHVDHDVLSKIIDNAKHQHIDKDICIAFDAELKKAKSMTYILDNSGEVVFDKIFIQLLQKNYPDLHITAIVRGGEAFNDVTLVEAEEVGLTDIVEVIDNGTEIPGTQLDLINQLSSSKINNSDIILSKGQGNFESLYGCGKNIYYIFLCKCNLFTEMFNVEKFTGIFSSEEGIHKLAPDLI